MNRPALTPSASRRPLSVGAMPGVLPHPGGRPWRCRACAALLGMERDGELHVKYKEAVYSIRGQCRHGCRRCGAMNVLLVPPPPVRAVPTQPQGVHR